MRPIDGDALVEHLEKLSEAYNELYNNLEVGNPSKSIMYGKFTTLVETMIDVKRMHTLDYEPVRHGEWIEDDTPFIRQRKCSLCGKCDNPRTAIRGHYCWYCGAKMDGGEE